MSFWRTFGFTVSAVETILEKDEFTLEELLEEEEVLQECKSQNKKLLDFLTEPENLSQLVTYVTEPAEDESNVKRAHKYPYVSCELLCSEVWQICDAVYKDESLLDRLYTFLDKEDYSPMHLSYSCRVCGVLLQRKISETIQYLQKRDSVIEKFIDHLANSSVMELLLKIIACEDTVEGSGVLKWLSEANLIHHLVSKFAPKYGEEVHENASQALLDIIGVSMTSVGSPLMLQLESEETIQQMIQFAIEEKDSDSTSVLLHGLAVINELLRRSISDVPDTETSSDDLPPLLKTLTQQLDKFYDILANPKEVEFLTANGLLKPAFGFARLKVLEMFLSLLRTKFSCIDEKMIELGVFESCLDLFFKYEQNNFLHHTVEQMILITLEGYNAKLVEALFVKAKLLDRIAVENENHARDVQENPKAPRRGYVGFTTVIADHIEKAARHHEQIAEICEGNEVWQAFVTGLLAQIREVESKPLGGTKPIDFPAESSDEDDGDSIFNKYRLGFSDNLTDDFDDDSDDDLEDDLSFKSSDDFDEHGDFGTDRNFDDMDSSSEDSSDVDEDDLLSDSDDLSSEEEEEAKEDTKEDAEDADGASDEEEPKEDTEEESSD